MKHRGGVDLRLPQRAGTRRPHPGVQAAEGDSAQGASGEQDGSAADAATGQQIAPASAGQSEPQGEPADVKEDEHENPRPPQERQGRAQRRRAGQQGDGGKGGALRGCGPSGLEGVGVSRAGL